MDEAQEPDPWSAGPKAGWITVDTWIGAFDCQRCTAHQPFDKPVNFFAWHEAARDFVADHRGCKAPAKDIEQVQTSLL